MPKWIRSVWISSNIFWKFCTGVFFRMLRACSTPPLPNFPPPPSRIHSSGGAQKNRGENFAARSFGFVAQAQVAGGAFSAPPSPEFGGEFARAARRGLAGNAAAHPPPFPRRLSGPKAECPSQPSGFNRLQRDRESVFSPVRRHSAGSGECGRVGALARYGAKIFVLRKSWARGCPCSAARRYHLTASALSCGIGKRPRSGS